MKKILLLLLILICLQGFTQTDTVFYNTNNDTVASLSLANKYETITHSATAPSEEIRRKYTKAGQLIAEDYYYINRGAVIPERKNKERIGTSRRWYDNGKIKRVIVYTDDKINGSCKTYWENGQIKRNDVFENGKFILGNCYTSQGKDTMHYDFEVMPEFKGGLNELISYMQKSVTYPEKSKKKNIEGKVFVKFVVEADGSITNITVLKGVNEELDNEAIRVIKNMPKWNPGKDDGVPIRVYFNIPINFRLK